MNKEYWREYRKVNKERINLQRRENYKNCEQKRNKRKKQAHKFFSNRKINKKESRFKQQQRALTIHKYGRPLKGWEYHHTTNPYNKDIWIMMKKEDHILIHKIQSRTQ